MFRLYFRTHLLIKNQESIMKFFKLGFAAVVIVSLISLAWYFVRQQQFLMVGVPTALLLTIIIVMIMRQEKVE